MNCFYNSTNKVIISYIYLKVASQFPLFYEKYDVYASTLKDKKLGI